MFEGLTKDEVVASAIVFFLAGYETTAATLNFILYELTLNPYVQEKASFFVICFDLVIKMVKIAEQMS